MHMALEQKEGQPQILQAVLSARSADHSITNSENFNVLQFAAFKNVPAWVATVVDTVVVTFAPISAICCDI